jgi:hypothetical protein
MNIAYDMDGNPMSVMEWSEAWAKDRHLGKTDVGPYYISTVWLGLDHGGNPNKPLIFETMVFGPDETCDELTEQYHTKEEALAGHDRIVAIVAARVENATPQTPG